eukprot:1477843-Pyramimonas_sp.AAC.2
MSQVFIGGNLVGGADDVEALLASGELKTILAAAEGVEPLPQVLKSTLQAALAAEAAGAQGTPTGSPPEGTHPPEPRHQTGTLLVDYCRDRRRHVTKRQHC